MTRQQLQSVISLSDHLDALAAERKAIADAVAERVTAAVLAALATQTPAPAAAPVKQLYTTSEASAELAKHGVKVSAWTLRYQCEQGKIAGADKRMINGGRAERWVIPASEVERRRNHGL